MHKEQQMAMDFILSEVERMIADPNIVEQLHTVKMRENGFSVLVKSNVRTDYTKLGSNPRFIIYKFPNEFFVSYISVIAYDYEERGITVRFANELINGNNSIYYDCWTSKNNHINKTLAECITEFFKQIELMCSGMRMINNKLLELEVLSKDYNIKLEDLITKNY